MNLSLSVSERLFVPALIGGIYALLSGGFMVTVKGATPRMRVVWRYSLFFILGTIYCMAWHDVLAFALHWNDAWILLASLLAAACIALCKRALERLRSFDDIVE